MVRHHQVVLDAEIEPVVARPPDVESLALDGASGHVHELLQHEKLGVGVEAGIVDHGARDEREGKVTRVDRETLPFADVEARLASAGQRGVLDIVVDERRGMEVLDGRRRRPRLRGVATHGVACQQADERAVALAGIRVVVRQRIVEVPVHVRMGAAREEGAEVLFELLRVALQVELERCGQVALLGIDETAVMVTEAQVVR